MAMIYENEAIGLLVVVVSACPEPDHDVKYGQGEREQIASREHWGSKQAEIIGVVLGHCMGNRIQGAAGRLLS